VDLEVILDEEVLWVDLLNAKYLGDKDSFILGSSVTGQACNAGTLSIGLNGTLS
jgi:hypothetical protein